MKKRMLALALAAAAVIMLLAGCGESKPVLKIYNAGKYIDRSVLTEFEEQYDCKVVYDEFDSNESMYLMIDNSEYTYDVVVPSDYFIDRLIKEDKVVPLDKSLIPNLSAVNAAYLNPVYDPDNTYSVPYMVGTLGILYNTTMVDDPVDSWEILRDEKYKDQIFMWDSVRDALAVGLLATGSDINTEDDAELARAKEWLLSQRPMVQAYITDETADKMIAGEGALALVYSGEAAWAMEENEDLAYAVPKEGSNYWMDSFVVLKTGQQQELAMQFINFMCEKDIAARNMAETGYASPITDAADEAILTDEVYYASPETLARCTSFIYTPAITEKYAKIWEEVLTE